MDNQQQPSRTSDLKATSSKYGYNDTSATSLLRSSHDALYRSDSFHLGNTSSQSNFNTTGKIRYPSSHDDRANALSNHEESSISKSESLVRVDKGGHIHIIKNAGAFKLGFAHSIYSNEFTINGHTWRIISYLGGETEDVSEYVSLFLGYVGPYQQCRANWSLRIVNQLDPTKSKTKEWKKGDKYNTFQKGRRWGWQKFILQSQAFEPDNGFLGNDLSITFEADVEVYGFIASSNPVSSPSLKPSMEQFDRLVSQSYASLSSDFEHALHFDDAFTDTQIECDNECFFAHSQILAMRSPVFARMLSGPFRERLLSKPHDHETTNHPSSGSSSSDSSDHGLQRSQSFPSKFRISITDIEPYVLKEMIKYIYTGKIDFTRLKDPSKDAHNSSSDISTPANIERLYYLSTSNAMNHDLCHPSKRPLMKKRRTQDKHVHNGLGEHGDSDDNNHVHDALHRDGSDKILSSPLSDYPSISSPNSAFPTSIHHDKQTLEDDTTTTTTTTNNGSNSVSDTSNKRKRGNSSNQLINHSEENDSTQYPVNTFDFVAALVDASDKYEINHLRKLCEAYLAQTVSAHTALNTLLLADRHSSHELKHYTLKYLSNVTNLTYVRKICPNTWEMLDKSLKNEILNYVITESSKSNDIISDSHDFYDIGTNQSAIGVSSASHNPASLLSPSPLSLGSSTGNANTPLLHGDSSASLRDGASSLHPHPYLHYSQLMQSFPSHTNSAYYF